MVEPNLRNLTYQLHTVIQEGRNNMMSLRRIFKNIYYGFCIQLHFNSLEIFVHTNGEAIP